MDFAAYLETYSHLLSPTSIAALVSLSIFLLWLAISSFRSPEDIEERLDDYMVRPTAESEQASDVYGIKWSTYQQLLFNVLRALGRLGPQKNTGKIERMLAEAGNPGGLSALDFIGLRLLSAIVIAGLTFLIVFKKPSSSSWLFLSISALFGYMLPNFWLRRRIKKRQKEILRALPDALDMLTIGVEAGLSFEMSMLRVSAQWDNELTREFRRVVAEIRLGTPRSLALQHMAERTGVQELRAFVTILNQSAELGISIANVLRSQADDLREYRRLRAEELAHQATVKMVFPLVFLIFPALFVVILGPAITIFLNLFGTAGQ